MRFANNMSLKQCSRTVAIRVPDSWRNLIGKITFVHWPAGQRMFSRARSFPTNLQCKPRPEEWPCDTCTISKGLYASAYVDTYLHIVEGNIHCHLLTVLREIDARTLLSSCLISLTLYYLPRHLQRIYITSKLYRSSSFPSGSFTSD